MINVIYFYILLVIKYMKGLLNKSKIVVNNIEHLLIKEYYIKYLSKTNELYKKNTIYDKEILNYSNIYSRLEKIRQKKTK
jgi:hypothetical protein